MSARSRAAHHDETPIQIPVSAGFPIGVRISFVSAIVLAVAILGLVVAASAANHVWPSGNSLKVPL